MNTVKIGNKFEERVLSLFNDELKQGRLLFNPEYCQIFHKKGYYSKERKKEIIVDISIEVRLPDETKWSILVVIECKDYNHKIPVDDVEEFNSKLQQIAGVDVKGIIASSNSFQEGAINYSSARGIGLVRILKNNMKWILTRAVTGLITYEQIENSKLDIYDGLTDEDYINENIDFYANYKDKFTHSLKQLLEFLFNEVKSNENDFDKLLINEENNHVFVPYMQEEEIEKISNEILSYNNYSTLEVPIKEICNNLEKEKEIKFQFQKSLGTDALGFEILGKISFQPSTVVHILNNVSMNPYRIKFTIAHELGHFFLNHFNYLYSEYYSEKDYQDEIPTLIDVKDIKRLEWQANYFASCLLLPKENFIREFLKLILKEEIKNRGYGILFVDSQNCNLKNFYLITNTLKDIFQVSRKVIEIRLKNLDLLTDVRK